MKYEITYSTIRIVYIRNIINIAFDEFYCNVCPTRAIKFPIQKNET